MPHGLREEEVVVPATRDAMKDQSGGFISESSVGMSSDTVG